jgi:hypothetical protein
MTRHRQPLESATMFWSGGCFSLLLAAIGIWLHFGVKENERILETGRKTTVTVLSKSKGLKGRSPVVEVRLDDLPDLAPFPRTLLGEQWEKAEPGGKLPYVYDPADPQGGVLGVPADRKGIPPFLALGAGVFVVPFLVIGAVLKVREMKRTLS